MTIIEIASNEHFNELLAGLQMCNYKYLICYYYSEGCLLCKYVTKPVIDKLNEKYKENVLINLIEVNTSNENLKEINNKCNINYVPSIIIFEVENNKIKCDMTVGRNITLIESKIDSLIEQNK